MTRQVYCIVKYLSLLIALFLPFLTFSQSVVTTDSSSVVSPKDSIITEIEIKDSSTFYNHLYNYFITGINVISNVNLGAFVDYPEITLDSNHPGFRSFHQFLEFPISETKVNHSYFSYLKGTKQEQAFTAGFSQKLLRYFHLQGNFRSINSPGFFINQENKILNYQGSLGYLSKNNKYRFFVSYIPTVIDEQVNGGIRYDSLLAGIANNTGKSLEVNLDDASFKYRDKKLFVSNKFHALRNDSIANISWFVAHRLSYNTSSFIYNSASANLDFYNSVYFDSTSTSDSLNYSSLSNEIAPGFAFVTNKGKGESGLVVGIENVRYHTFDSTINYQVIKTGLDVRYSSDSNFYEFKGIIESSDVYEKGIELKADAKLYFKSLPFNIKIDISYLNRFPELFYGHYTSNHFRWTNKFRNTETTEGTAQIATNNNAVKLTASIYNLKNYIYFDQTAIPRQNMQAFNIYKIKTVVNVPVAANFHFYGDISFQQASNANIYRLPALYTYSAIYHEGRIFKKALKLSVGVGCHYFSEFKANAFMPATSQFYLQDEIKIGNYPNVDFFVNFRIRTASFFIRLENLNQGVSESTNFYLPHQPSPGRCLKVGLKWVFSEYQRASL